MKREILFRGKSADHLGWEFGSLIESFGDLYIGNTVGNDRKDWCKVIPETVGQFTGLKDKNKTKIFEGDILKSKSGLLFEVRFINSQWMSTQINPFSSRGLTYEAFYSTVITGNIHDNPINP